jgi:hypothetical protein
VLLAPLVWESIPGFGWARFMVPRIAATQVLTGSPLVREASFSTVAMPTLLPTLALRGTLQTADGLSHIDKPTQEPLENLPPRCPV